MSWEKLDWLPINNRINQCVLLISFKFVNGIGPNYLNETFQWATESSRTLRNNYGKLKHPFRKTSDGQNLICFDPQNGTKYTRKLNNIDTFNIILKSFVWHDLLNQALLFTLIPYVETVKLNCKEPNWKVSEEQEENSGIDFEGSKVIHLNVGGWKFSTSLTTLRSQKGSYFERMFSGKIGLMKEKDGTIFIDRSGEHFNIILDYLRGNISGIHDFLFDENTRKKLIKEADYYHLDSMKDMLDFKKTALLPEDNGKAEILDIIERVVHNKEQLQAILSGSGSTGRRKIRKQIEDLKLKKRDRDSFCTTERLQFENAQWDNVSFENVYFFSSVTFKNCSFVEAKFKNCCFGRQLEETNVNFYNCDLICTDFSGSSFHCSVDFNGSDLRCANFRGIDKLGNLIATDLAKFTKAKYPEKAQFDEDALKAILGKVSSFY